MFISNLLYHYHRRCQSGTKGAIAPQISSISCHSVLLKAVSQTNYCCSLRSQNIWPPQILGWLGQWSLYRFIVIRYTVCCRFLSEHCWTRPIIVEKESVPTVCQERRKVYLKLWSNSIMFNRGSKNLSLRCQWFLMCAFSCLNCIFIVK